jgi:sigma-B regulation protein RsbU (phosphoserine phosphatase)
MATLPPVTLGAILASAFGLTLLIRQPLQNRTVEAAAEIAQPKRQFFMDVFLVVFAGMLAGVFNTLVFAFPLASSGTLLMGCMVSGFFLALDTALARERTIIVQAISRNQISEPPERLFSMTRKFSLAALATVLFFSIVFFSVFSRDIVWLSAIGKDTATLYRAQLSVAYEITFIMGVLLILVINLILSYSRNLKLLFSNETRILEKVTRGDLSEKVPVATHDEFGIIAGHTNTMIDGLRHRLQLINALKLAEEIQRNLLPGSAPRHSKLDLSGISLYCEEIGGDYFDFFQLPGDKMGIVVADAAGHGISAAMHMTGARAFLRFAVSAYENPAKLLNTINRFITQDSRPTSRFLSMFFLEIDPAHQKLRWVRAGHEPALLYDPETDTFKQLGGEGMALGVLDTVDYQGNTLQGWTPGSIIAIGTDGIHESRDSNDTLFGRERLRQIIVHHARKPAESIQKAVIEALQEFRGAASQEDDITLVVVKLL